jgi:hypothetical protein
VLFEHKKVFPPSKEKTPISRNRNKSMIRSLFMANSEIAFPQHSSESVSKLDLIIPAGD